jgi:hypothetical protein
MSMNRRKDAALSENSPEDVTRSTRCRSSRVFYVGADRVPVQPYEQQRACPTWRRSPRRDPAATAHGQTPHTRRAHKHCFANGTLRPHVIAVRSMPPTTLSAFHPSPKRKREQPPPMPLLNTALRPASTPPAGSPTLSGGDSPRNAVADQLRSMSLTSSAAIAMDPLSPTDDTVHKKPKLEVGRADSGVSLAEHLKGPRTTTIQGARAEDTEPAAAADPSAREVPETPQAYTQPRIFADIAAFAQPTAFPSSPIATLSHGTIPSSQTSFAKDAASQPRPRKKSPSPPLSTLTWQDSEITGHLADPSKDPDDDGTGLNGIGFRPTPTIAYVRAQKRKQQIQDWKAREAREARAKRSERRRRGVGGKSSREPTIEREMPAKTDLDARRTVKFAV